jgi:tRNA-specific 2-thiouridylase
MRLDLKFYDPRLEKAQKALVAMSGGIDSSFAAFKLLSSGIEVLGVYLKMFPEEGPLSKILPVEKQRICIEKASRVAGFLGIDFEVVDVSREFEQEVINYFIRTYLSGKTPNPCVFCNPLIKFSTLTKIAENRNFDLVATGHYARIQLREDGTVSLLKPVDASKDQTYYLYRLTEEQLRISVFPNADTHKKEIMSLSADLFPDIKFESESQEVCFIKDDYRNFLYEIVPDALKPGKFVDKNGNILGVHRGTAFYTVGQRKGLGISLGRPVYVIKIDAAKNEITLGDKEDLFPHGIRINSINFIRTPEARKFSARVKVRYRMDEVPCEVTLEDEGSARIIFLEKCPFPAPGQSAVLYNEDEVLGGGIVEEWLV